MEFTDIHISHTYLDYQAMPFSWMWVQQLTGSSLLHPLAGKL